MHNSLRTFLAVSLIAAGYAVAPAWAADASGTSETRSLGSFDQIEASRGIDVTLTCGPTAQAKIEGESAQDVAETETKVEGHRLTVRRASMWGGGHHRAVHVEVTVPAALGFFSASSGASIKGPACAASTERLNLEASSGGTLTLAGSTARLDAEASSGGTIAPPHGERLDAGDARLSASSGGTIGACKVGALRGTASSGGSIETEAGGTSNEIHTSSGGNIGTRNCS